jgi:hypothetical protein
VLTDFVIDGYTGWVPFSVGVIPTTPFRAETLTIALRPHPNEKNPWALVIFSHFNPITLTSYGNTWTSYRSRFECESQRSVLLDGSVGPLDAPSTMTLTLDCVRVLPST